MNTQKLKSIIVLNGETQRSLAEYLGITENTLSAKINGYKGADFSQTEIFKIKEKYNLDSKQLDEIFFDIKVS